MAPKKKATAPTSKKPVVLDSKEAAKVAKREASEAARQARVAKRAERSAANKAAWKVNRAAALQETKNALEAIRALPGQRKFGRPPPPWTEELGDQLYELISTGWTMSEIADLDDSLPSVFCMLKWRQDETHPFTKIYSRAKQTLADLLEEQAQTAATRPETFVQRTRKQVVTRDGDVVWVTENRTVDNVARSALKVSTIQWTLGHLKPKKHGKTPEPTSSGPNEQLKGLFDALKAGPVDR